MGVATRELPHDHEVRDLVKKVRAAGWPAQRTSAGHWHVWPPGATEPIGFAGTPGSRQALSRGMEALRRYGLEDAIKARRREQRAGRVTRRAAEATDDLPVNLDRQRFGKAVRQARVKADLTQRELAELIGCHQVAISHVELGGSFSMAVAHALRKVFGWEDLYGEVETVKPAPSEPQPAPVLERRPLPVAEPASASLAFLEAAGKLVTELNSWKARALAADCRVQELESRIRELEMRR